MRDSIYNLFLISEGLKGDLKRPLFTFFEKDYTAAKLFFKNFLEDHYKYCERYGEIKYVLTLHIIGEIDRNFKLNQKMIYICDSNHFKQDKTEKTIQMSIDMVIEQKKSLLEWCKNKTQQEIVIKVFNGKELNK